MREVSRHSLSGTAPNKIQGSFTAFRMTTKTSKGKREGQRQRRGAPRLAAEEADLPRVRTKAPLFLVQAERVKAAIVWKERFLGG
jgi:hypothetical protein